MFIADLDNDPAQFRPPQGTPQDHQKTVTIINIMNNASSFLATLRPAMLIDYQLLAAFTGQCSAKTHDIQSGKSYFQTLKGQFWQGARREAAAKKNSFSKKVRKNGEHIIGSANINYGSTV